MNFHESSQYILIVSPWVPYVANPSISWDTIPENLSYLRVKMAMGNGQSPTYRWFSFPDFPDIFFSLGPKPVFFTGHSRILNRRYLPYIIYQALRILKFPLVFQMVFQCFSQPSMEIFQPCWMTTVAFFFEWHGHPAAKRARSKSKSEKLVARTY